MYCIFALDCTKPFTAIRDVVITLHGKYMYVAEGVLCRESGTVNSHTTFPITLGRPEARLAIVANLCTFITSMHCQGVARFRGYCKS